MAMTKAAFYHISNFIAIKLSYPYLYAEFHNIEIYYEMLEFPVFSTSSSPVNLSEQIALELITSWHL